MVLNLVSEENGLDISFISYDVTFIDRCAQFTVTLKYKNISSLPLPLKFKNDHRDLGILIQLETKIGDNGGFKIENNTTSIYPLLNLPTFNEDQPSPSTTTPSSPNSIAEVEELIKKLSIYDDSTTTNMNIVDLLPGKEITMTSKYLKELPVDRFEDKQPFISIVIPKQTSITSPFPPIKIQVTTNGEVSIPLHSAACPSHPSSVTSLTLCENKVSSTHEINSNSLLNSDFNLIVALEKELNHCGWQYNFQTTTSPSILSPPLSPSSNDTPSSNNNNNNNIQVSSTIINICQELQKSPIDKLFINNVEYDNKSNLNNLIFYTIETNNNNNNSENNNINNNVTLKYNNNEYNVLLKNTTSKQLSNILNKYSSLSKIQQILTNSNNNNSNNKVDIGLLLNFVFISPEIPTSNSSSPSSNYASPLSFSAPPERMGNNNGSVNNPLSTSNIQLPNSFKLKSTKNNPVGLQLSGESLSKVLANLPRAKPSQSSTAPPTMGKVSNPIADFIASRGVTGGASLNPNSKDSNSTGGGKTLKKPPPKLGSSVAGGQVGGNLANLTNSAPAGNSNTLPTSGSNDDLSGMSSTDIRSSRLASYNKLNKMWNVTVSDFAERHSIESHELEAFALECGLNYIKSRWWKKNRIATLQEILVVRSLVGNIIYNPQIYLACGRNSLLNIQVVNNGGNSLDNSSNNSSCNNSRETSPILSPNNNSDTEQTPQQPTTPKAKPPPSNFLLSKTSFTDLTKLMNKSSSSLSSLTPPPQTLSPPLNTTTTTTTCTNLNNSNNNNNNNLSTSSESSSTTTMDDLDPVKLKWIIEEVLDSEKNLFERMTSPNQENLNSKNDHLWFTTSVGESKGGRPHMEDRHVIIEYPYDFYGLTEENGVEGGVQDSQFFFGVFDGHNGKIAAEYCRTSLPFEIYTHLAETQKRHSLHTSKDIPDQLYMDTIKDGYLATDHSFLEYARKEDKKAGTTAATVILLRDRIIVSNCGDTEVIISQNGKAKPLSTLHSPKLDTERERIEKAGGAVIHYGTLRVNGLLSVSRSLGDKNLKEYIIPDPDSLIYSTASNDHDFILIATDGLWEVFNYQDVVDYVFKLLSDTSISNDDISSIIIEEAIKRNSKDNITLLIIFLNK
ncbi:hypothetical protein DICPUDRAFT_96246 [Dictyostelium purpureum]|uniref:PPM-type phosphatase domain-containing protein n=1 Tax=Dictyostelium purpureum TaxID=5786 RepID=F0Z6I4_DICPU|nr:uncharacterized protein DICPUDRAFT_96246 [Dictyostelium purpureum]EGC40446.1 hypothetical protein DICPUDRAFT_96246 [Dictyostelium purpureum]|eukprot:XP_003282993.1 hypothetical protein DICPUDRAFT_96246 [Dictyostelium purpureum]